MKLSALQRDILAELGIDFFEPIKHETAIPSEIIEAQAELQTWVDSWSSAENVDKPLAAKEQNIQTPVHVGQVKPLESLVHASNSEKSELHHQKEPQKQENNLSNPLGLAVPPSVSIDDNRLLTPPRDHLRKPTTATPIFTDWQALNNAIAQSCLNEKNIENFTGLGNPQAEWCFVLPPTYFHNQSPYQARENSQNLLHDIISAMNKTVEDIYLTPFVKAPRFLGLDPDQIALNHCYELLLSEMALVKPKIIFVFGRLPCQTILETKAPLSSLLMSNYRLQFTDHTNSQINIEVCCLPSLEYLITFPAQKKLVWQRLKALL